jgi:hypothetical protein
VPHEFDRDSLAAGPLNPHAIARSLRKVSPRRFDSLLIAAMASRRIAGYQFPTTLLTLSLRPPTHYCPVPSPSRFDFDDQWSKDIRDSVRSLFEVSLAMGGCYEAT